MVNLQKKNTFENLANNSDQIGIVLYLCKPSKFRIQTLSNEKFSFSITKKLLNRSITFQLTLNNKIYDNNSY